MKPLRIFGGTILLLAISLLLHIGMLSIIAEDNPTFWLAYYRYFHIGSFLLITVLGYFVLRGIHVKTRPPFKVLFWSLFTVQSITVLCYTDWQEMAEVLQGPDTVSINTSNLLAGILVALLIFAIVVPILVLAILYRIDKLLPKIDA